MKALMIGASGAVGREVLRLLLEDDDVHEIWHEAVEALCNNAREISVTMLDGQVASIEAICCFK